MESAKGMFNNGATPDVVSFAEETLADIASVATFDELVAAKTKEIDALIASIEDKTTAIGEQHRVRCFLRRPEDLIRRP